MQLSLNKEAILNEHLRRLNSIIAMYNKGKPKDEQRRFVSWTSFEDKQLGEQAEKYKVDLDKHINTMMANGHHFISGVGINTRNKVNIAEGIKTYRLKLEFFVHEVYKKVYEYTPKDTGLLVDKIRVSKDGDEFTMSVDTADVPYCVEVHQNLTYRHIPPTRAQFMKIGALEVSERYGKPYNINISITASRIELRFNSVAHNLVTSSFENRQQPSNNRSRQANEDYLDTVSFEHIWR